MSLVPTEADIAAGKAYEAGYKAGLEAALVAKAQEDGLLSVEDIHEVFAAHPLPKAPIDAGAEALKAARTLVISYRAHERGKKGNRAEYCQIVLDQIGRGAFGRGNAMKLTRTVTKLECPWLDADLPEGTEVYLYHGYTYGCIGPNGVAISLEENGPFLEVPRTTLSGEKP